MILKTSSTFELMNEKKIILQTVTKDEWKKIYYKSSDKVFKSSVRAFWYRNFKEKAYIALEI